MTDSSNVGFIHAVYFWLKEDTSEAQKKEFEKGLEALGETPMILKWYYGKPEPNDREVVDDTFDYSWTCHFKNSEDQAAYQIHPIHDVFIEQFKDLWKTVKVFDSILNK